MKSLILTFLFAPLMMACGDNPDESPRKPEVIAQQGGFEPNVYFDVRQVAGGIPVIGSEPRSVQRVAESVEWVLARVDPRVTASFKKQGVALYIINNEEELEANPELLEYLLGSRPLELIYTDIDGIDETTPEHRGTVAQKLMQLFVYYPLELDPQLADIKQGLESAFAQAIRPGENIGGRPVYDPESYSHPDEAHPHMGPPYYTALGAYLGLGYEVHFGLTHPRRDETEYYPITSEEMSQTDRGLVDFLNEYLR